ncbi:acyl-CoA dehydrogenase family protein [Solimonas soli]|uniref:acyl-CoA dehydrogenase family protein n=1 Tax=Solimonas soli TaxID=413479 RepID=UPI0004867E0A|nr:acyl-CoA dehydrogenase family protein [Solimonas soli]
MDDISAMLRDSAADFLEGRHQLSRLKGGIGKPQRVDRALWREMGELGWLGLELPESLGGSGMGLRESTVLAGQFGRSAFPAPYVAASVMPAVLLSFAGTPGASELAAALQGGDRLITLAWQEARDQLDADAPRARLQDGRVSGSKLFVPAVEDGGVLLVSVQEAAGLAIVAVAADAAGVAREDFAAGLGTVSTVHFDHAPILFGAPLLSGNSAKMALRRALDAGRVALSAQLEGLSSGMLDRTLDYVKGRVQFGRAIGSFQVIHHRCVDLYIAVQLAGASWRNALRAYEGGEDAGAAISAAKARCADTAQRIGREAIQMHGAMGFTEEADIGLYVRAQLQAYAWLGTPPQHRRRFMAITAEAEHV